MLGRESPVRWRGPSSGAHAEDGATCQSIPPAVGAHCPASAGVLVTIASTACTVADISSQMACRGSGALSLCVRRLILPPDNSYPRRQCVPKEASRAARPRLHEPILPSCPQGHMPSPVLAHYAPHWSTTIRQLYRVWRTGSIDQTSARAAAGGERLPAHSTIPYTPAVAALQRSGLQKWGTQLAASGCV